jgi:uncharacterized protein (TIGR02284 family)
VSTQPKPSELTSVDAMASTLNHLIRTCLDGQNGFEAAAKDVNDPNLQRLFESYAQQRTEFAAELQQELRRLGQEAEDSGHAAAALHRGLIDVKAAVSGKDEGTVISECERGEDVAVKAYETALGSSLPDELRTLVERQFLKIKEAHDQIRSLERTHDRHT